MLTIKSVYGLLDDEKTQIQEIIDTFYSRNYNNIYENSIIVFDKINENEITGCICANMNIHPEYSISNQICV